MPVVLTLPGILVIVQTPDEGNPLSTTLPVGTEKVGWVILPTTGAEGVGGCVLTLATEETFDMHPTAFLTVKVYVPADKPDTTVVVPVPVVTTPSLYLVSVQVPVFGNPLIYILPVDTVHVGCAIESITGGNGVSG